MALLSRPEAQARAIPDEASLDDAGMPPPRPRPLRRSFVHSHPRGRRIVRRAVPGYERTGYEPDVAPASPYIAPPRPQRLRSWPHAPVKKVLPPPHLPQERQAAAGHSEPVETIESAEVEVAPDKEGPATWWGDAWPVWDRIIDAHTPRITRKHKFNTLIVHRNYGGFGTQPFHSLLGFDQGLLKVGLGVRYGIFDWLDVGVLRVNGTIEVFNTYEFDVKTYALNQDRFGLDLGLRVGISWFEQYQQKDAVGFFAQLLLGRLFFDRLYVGAGLLFHNNSSGPKKSSSDVHESTAVQIYVDGRILPGLSIALELTPNIAGYSLCNPIFTMGPRFITNRHTFTIALSNSQYYDADGIVAGTDRTRFDNWVLGFNITRELG